MCKKIVIVCVLIWVSIATMAQDKKIAIFDPVGNVESSIKEIVREEVSSSILSIGGYIVLERAQISKVLEENEIQLSGLVDDSQISEIGKMMGANFVLVTNISPIGENCHISCKVIEVSTARIDKQTTVRTTWIRTNRLIVAVQKAINDMFQKETALRLQGRKIFANDVKLDNNKIRGLMANTEALEYYNRSKSQKKTGTALVWTGALVIVAGAAFDVISQIDGNYTYVREGNIIYEREVFKLNGTVIGGAAGAALIGAGIVLRSSSKKTLQKSVDAYNSGRRTAQTEIQWGFTGNGIGLVINF